MEAGGNVRSYTKASGKYFTKDVMAYLGQGVHHGFTCPPLGCLNLFGLISFCVGGCGGFGPCLVFIGVFIVILFCFAFASIDSFIYV